jgi:hypothetical protein
MTRISPKSEDLFLALDLPKSNPNDQKNHTPTSAKKASNLVLHALQADKGDINCWDAYLKFSFDKGLWSLKEDLKK